MIKKNITRKKSVQGRSVRRVLRQAQDKFLRPRGLPLSPSAVSLRTNWSVRSVQDRGIQDKFLRQVLRPRAQDRGAQDKQDEIFRKMSADRKLELWFQFWRFANELRGDKIRHGSR
ncbi:MAG: hypothetical protein A2939_02510 [Parcubacteria group bacterium RIFCSPLOWO2_01_FULL_48_18]|nr:MAG: hypothetical protein A3J67_05730 [Parcubacteria group bacterium RIFCSPHIGHO2_02_FULL_48_10b]OHB23307.1 MAG: hypothetical protein A2939_02510 [Parcubacteria group bacterium RIFCSPLOWO2_01_FULL_48_18]